MTAWDGDQLLHETRYPTDSLHAAFDPERETGDATPAQRSYPCLFPPPISPPPDLCYDAPDPILRNQFGQVTYTHAGGIDAPIGLLRLWSPDLPGPLVVPHANWRGAFATGTSATGAVVECPTVAAPPAGCLRMDWPAPTQYMYQSLRQRQRAGPAVWLGTLANGGRSTSGQVYMRNRYYDAQTGRFTQEDPIGLAGGVNSFGFANGDPVNFSDPFGLCVDGVSTLACLYAAFEVGSTVYDLYDLAKTTVRWARGQESGSALGVTAAGVGVGVLGFGGGYGRMARAAMNALDDLSAAARIADRGGLTKAGRALAKHNDAFGDVKGNPAELNRRGQDIVDDILTDPGSKFTARRHARYGDVIEVRAPDGRGVRYNEKREFICFLEPNK